jgi:hypothetical protein
VGSNPTLSATPSGTFHAWTALEINDNAPDDDHDLARGDVFQGEPLNRTHELQRFLKPENIECSETNPGVKTLRPVFLRALLEHFRRAQDILKGEIAKEQDPLF